MAPSFFASGSGLIDDDMKLKFTLFELLDITLVPRFEPYFRQFYIGLIHS